MKKHSSVASHANFHLLLSHSLTVRFHWIENTEERKEEGGGGGGLTHSTMNFNPFILLAAYPRLVHYNKSLY